MLRKVLSDALDETVPSVGEISSSQEANDEPDAAASVTTTLAPVLGETLKADGSLLKQCPVMKKN